ncbi:hypothetical protein GW931_00770 [archaeon]|nr:hypothetical protein [archaeon]PJC45357.1 MAG: hypothetical protein CO037_01920 [Candidatus Pacearchaeota archaeon CG_4_9_14_0_2_um_filter_30_8]
MENILPVKEEKKSFFEKFPFFKNYYFLGGLILIILVILIFFLLSFSNPKEVIPFQKCGDGTFEGYCSIKKPFFCEQEVLVEKISECGCPTSFKFSNGNCISKYGSSSNESFFSYFLSGEKKEISIKIFPEVVDYLLNLTRTKIYYNGEVPRRDDFKISKIEEPVQEDYLSPLVTEIQNLAPNSKDLQAKIAVSLVQNIIYNESEFVVVPGFNVKIRLSRYPYQVLEEAQGSCEGKSELLAFLLKEMGFGVTLFYFPEENHEAVGIKCPLEYSYLGTGYCFVETTMPSPISFSEGKYLGAVGQSKLVGVSEFVLISDGISLSGDLEDYADSESLVKLTNKIDQSGSLNPVDKLKMDSLREKYNLKF